jgi:hypothetical protein
MMLSTLRRHPFPVRAFFRYSLVLTFAYPEEILRPLLPPGLTLDSYEGCGFLAIALVQTENLRPAGLPAALGRDFFLSGYRIFSRFREPGGRKLRGLRILRSDADSRWMVWSGNLLTHYHYRKCRVESARTPEELAIHIVTPKAEADLSVRARIAVPAETPPAGSPFPDLKVARRFAGPLPFTFDYEPESDRMVLIEGVREDWNPKPVSIVEVHSSYLAQPPFAAVPPRLANAFFLESISYRWKRGIVQPLSRETA